MDKGGLLFFHHPVRKTGLLPLQNQDSEFLAVIVAWDMGGACLSLTCLLTSFSLLSLSFPAPLPHSPIYLSIQ